MKTKLILTALAASLLFSLTACSGGVLFPSESSEPAPSSSQASSGSEDGLVLDDFLTDSDSDSASLNGYLGDTMHTMFFDFSVESAQWIDEVNGYTAGEGNALFEAVVKVTNTYGETIPMGTYDFQVQWGGEGEDDYTYQPDEISGDGIMPAEFELADGETVEYRLIGEVPAGSTNLSISYAEYYYTEDGEDGVGDTYFVDFQL